MEIVKGVPPNYDSIIKAGMNPTPETVFTFGYHLFIQNQETDSIPDFLMAHEEVHAEQQGAHPEIWWKKYLENSLFRYEQELEAYAAEYAFIKKNYGSDQHKESLFQFAYDLCSPIYSIPDLSIPVVESRIRNRAKLI